MTRRRWLALAAAAALLAGGWYGWRWLSAPRPPAVPLEDVTPQTVEVVEKATRRVRDQPRSGEAWGGLGLALVATGYKEQALECLAHARRLDPAQARWPYWQAVTLRTSDTRRAIDRFREALALAEGRDARASVLFALAQELIEVQDEDEARTHVRALGELEPDGPRYHFVAGLLAVAVGDRPAVRDHLGRLTEVPFARQRACALLANAVDDPREAQNYRDRAAALAGDADWPTAFDDDLAPYKLDLSPHLAAYRALMAQGRQDDALAYLRAAAARSPDEAVCSTLGTALMAREPAEAEAAFRQSLTFEPGNAKTHFFLAVLLLRRGQTTRSKEALTQAVASADAALGLRNDMAYAHLIRGRALKGLGRREEATAAFRAALLRGSEYAEVHQELGEALAEAGQVAEGLKHLEDAARLAKPDDPGPRRALEAWRAKQ